MTTRHLRRTRPLVLATAAALALAGCAGGAGDQAAEDPAVPLTDTEEDTDVDVDVDGQAVTSVSTDLVLSSVRIRATDLDNQRAEFTEYCFAAPIEEVGDPGAFALVGFDPSNRVQAETVVLDEDDRSCAVVGYESGTDVTSFTLGTVANGAVESRDGDVNVKDSSPIAGAGDEGEARRGATSAPELLRVSIDPSLEQARYVFDENELAMASGSAQAFGFYTLAGKPVTANAVVSVEDSVAVVEFADGGQLEDAVRFFVQPGAVQDQQGTANDRGAVGARTAAPDLVSVTANSPSQYDFRFDEPVKQEQANGFFLFTADAQRLEGSAVTRPDENTVRVVFEEAGDISSSIVRGTVADGAVQSLNSSGTTNTIGADRVRGGDAEDQGETSGPDLVDVTLEADTGRATFLFDSTLVEDSPALAAFSLITESGDVVEAREIVNVTGGDVTGDMVVVLFDEATAEAAVLASVGTGAVEGQQGNRNAVATLSVS